MGAPRKARPSQRKILSEDPAPASAGETRRVAVPNTSKGSSWQAASTGAGDEHVDCNPRRGESGDQGNSTSGLNPIAA